MCTCTLGPGRLLHRLQRAVWGGGAADVDHHARSHRAAAGYGGHDADLAEHSAVRHPDELIIVVPLSSLLAPSALRIDVTPDAGIERPSRAVRRAVRAVVSSRFVRRIGSVDQATMEQVQMALALILELDRKRALE